MTEQQTTLPEVTATTLAAERLREAASHLAAAAESGYPAQLEQFARLLAHTFANGRKLLVFGNGGSSSDAQHLCGELVVRFQVNRRALPAIALGTDTAVITACGNDFCFEEIFARQVEALGAKGDVALGISTSGSSSNVICGLKAGANAGLTTVMLTGAGKKPAADFCDFVIQAPAAATARIQELHLVGYHIICEMIENSLSGERA